jgi:uncharacterized membrane protein HdeD (DUF308 family)
MMSAENLTVSDMKRAVRDTVRLHWQLFLAQGVIMLILGIVAIVWPQISTIAVDVFVGWLFLLSGIVGILTMFLARDVQAFLWMLLTAALALFVGVMLVWHPAEGAASLTVVLTAFFIVEGVVQIVASLSYRDIFPNQWGWMLASGIADLILAGIIIAGWPSTATWVLGLLVGVNLITSGAAITSVALAAREVVKTFATAGR